MPEVNTSTPGSCRHRNFVVCDFIKNNVTDRRLNFASPFVAVVNGQDGISSRQQHHAVTAKVDVARASRFSLASKRGADLLYNVSRKARFVRIDLRDSAFEI